VDSSSDQAELGKAKQVLVGQEPKLAKRDEVTMKVARIVPNPRLIQCIYRDESGVERKALVKVGRSQHFVVGMTLKAIRSVRDSEVKGILWATAAFQGTMVTRFVERKFSILSSKWRRQTADRADVIWPAFQYRIPRQGKQARRRSQARLARNFPGGGRRGAVRKTQSSLRS
jgi:hypothetical protein